MKIGIDIDEVLAEQLDELIKFYHQTKGKLIPRENFHTYYWPEVWGVTLEEAIQIDNEFKSSTHFDNLEPLNHAVESLKKLAISKKLIIITARPILFKEKTEIWLKKHLKEIPFELIHSSDFHTKNSQGTKAQICEELGIKIMIEDQSGYALECANKGITVLLFDKPWNRELKHKNVIRVNGWIEAIDVIDSQL